LLLLLKDMMMMMDVIGVVAVARLGTPYIKGRIAAFESSSVLQPFNHQRYHSISIIFDEGCFIILC